MRRLERNRARTEEEESVFVTMTDMTISFLLIIMILLAFFATLINDEEFALPEVCENIRDQDVSQDFSAEIVGDCIEELVDQVKSLEARLAQASRENEDLREELGQLKNEQLPIANRLETYMSQSTEQRREFLDKLREGLLVEFPELQVVVSPEQDALRFQGEGLFRSGSSRLEPRQREIVETLGRLLDETLVCFTLGERAERGPDCKSGNALIEAVQIEGHTDSDGTDLNNLRLSTERANATLLVMLDEDRSILEHQNLRGQPVMSVSGYGEMRPIEKNDTIERKAANRRIDLRIIMYAPSKVMDVEEVERRLDALRDAGEAQ